jgi:hypothetical protein
MNCFNHQEQAAVGTCKHCCKGLCSACSTDLGFGLACKDVHEQQVTAVSSMVERAVNVQPRSLIGRYASPIFLASFGVLFGGYELLFARKASGLGLALAVIFLAYGAYCALAVRKSYSLAKA